jgi:hypothetical protein
MKKIFALFLILLSLKSYAQEAMVEKSIFGIQAGFPGSWLYNESKIAGRISLRTEAGVHFFFEKPWSANSNTAITPVFTLEPRYYYNLKRRDAKGRRTANNSGDYLTIKLSYSMYEFNSNQPGKGLNNLFIIPMWGLRRSYGKHFNFETGAGLGEAFYLNNSSAGQIRNLLVADLQFRVGYKF